MSSRNWRSPPAPPFAPTQHGLARPPLAEHVVSIAGVHGMNGNFKRKLLDRTLLVLVYLESLIYLYNMKEKCIRLVTHCDAMYLYDLVYCMSKSTRQVPFGRLGLGEHHLPHTEAFAAQAPSGSSASTSGHRRLHQAAEGPRARHRSGDT